MDPYVLKSLNVERLARRAAIVVTDLGDGRDRLVRAGDPVAGELGRAVAIAFRTGKSGVVTVEGREFFLNAHMPAPLLVIVGAVHISQALAPMAHIAGFSVEIVDPRTAFATAERFPGVTLRPEWPQDAFAARPLDAWMALAAVTHDPRIDDIAVKAGLEAGCFYVGALGGLKAHARRVERLLAAGVAPDQIARIDAPIGLNIGAANPAEIAVATLGQVIAAFRSRGLDRGPAIA